MGIGCSPIEKGLLSRFHRTHHSRPRTPGTSTRFLAPDARYAQTLRGVESFPDRIIFRDLQGSVDRLSEMLREDELHDDPRGSIGIVTHSFGDWIARQAIPKTPRHRVAALASVNPVMRAGPLIEDMHFVTRNLIPEVRVIMDPAQASANLRCDKRIRRLVIWASVDGFVRPVNLDPIEAIQILRVCATHISAIVQPSVLNLIADSLFPSGSQNQLLNPTRDTVIFVLLTHTGYFHGSSDVTLYRSNHLSQRTWIF